MHKRKTFFILALALILATACSLTNQATRGAAVVKTPPGTPTASATPETIATPTPSPQRCTVATGTPQGRLNLRACAGTNCGVLLVLEEGQAVEILQLGDWLQVRTEAGAVGFINSKYCEKVTK